LNNNSLNSAAPFEVAGCRVEPSILRVTRAGVHARLESKAMQVLVYLVEHAGRVASRSELEQHLWPGRVVTEDAVTNAIAKLRRVFGDDARQPLVIETVPKIGYRLIAQVMPIGEVDERARASSIPTTHTEGRAWRPSAPWVAGAILVLLLLVGIWGFLGKDEAPVDRTGPLSGKPAVAILPFENLGASPEQDYFANGITADLITDLSKVSGLLVIAPGSVFVYKDSGARPKQISAELDVDYVVLGSVQRSGDRLRVNVLLMEASAERALWGERYDGAMDDIFEVQDKITAAVILALEIELAPTERAVLARRPTASIAAYDYYLRGLEDHGHRTKEQNLSAREHFRRAIDLDPSFARAYAGLALTHSRDAIDGWTVTPSRSLEQAANLADKAAEMDPSLPQVHFVTGQVDLFRRRHVQAIEAAQRAIQVDPNYADAYALSAWILNYAGRPVKALASMEMAMRLNPRPTASYLEVLGEIRFAQGQYAESVSLFERVLDINPNYTRARMWIAAALAHAGSRDRADWEATELLVLSPDFTLTRLEFAFPFKDPLKLDVLLDGLRKAGLTD
jgi:TolB-like protein/DNA-binding winged helix-turn-helix (wHTH) protein/Tfp pilus assembly protein PilF